MSSVVAASASAPEQSSPRPAWRKDGISAPGHFFAESTAEDLGTKRKLSGRAITALTYFGVSVGVAAEAGPVTRGKAGTSSTSVTAAAAEKVSRPAPSGAKSLGRSPAAVAERRALDGTATAAAVAEAAGGTAAAVAMTADGEAGPPMRAAATVDGLRAHDGAAAVAAEAADGAAAAAASGGDADAAPLVDAVGEVGAPECARARANKRVTFQLSELELGAARALEHWRLALNAIGARNRLLEAAAPSEGGADDGELVTAAADASDPVWDPTEGSGESDENSGDDSAEGSGHELATRGVEMTERAAGLQRDADERATQAVERVLRPAKRAKVTVGAWQASAAEEAATADGRADAAVDAVFSELDGDVRVHALARHEGLVLQRSVAWQKIESTALRTPR